METNVAKKEEAPVIPLKGVREQAQDLLNGSRKYSDPLVDKLTDEIAEKEAEKIFTARDLEEANRDLLDEINGLNRLVNQARAINLKSIAFYEDQWGILSDADKDDFKDLCEFEGHESLKLNDSYYDQPEVL